MTWIQRQHLSEIAAKCDIPIVGVTTSHEFDGLGDLLSKRIDAGNLRGLDWFTEERARFSAVPRNLQSSASSIISIGVPYWIKSIAAPNDEPRGRISRYAWGHDYHRTLKERMKQLHAALERELHRSIEARFLVDTARIVDRAVAARSGLGWYGKNTMILVPGHGSWVMLGDLLVDVEIEPDEPLRPKCGRCTACIDRCPTGAIHPGYVVETPRCISYLTIELRGAIPHRLRPRMANWVFGCDECQEVCPYTRAATTDHDEAFEPASLDNAFPRLSWLLTMSEQEFRDTYRGTAVLRTKRRGLARNAAVALGNTGTTDDLALLERVVCSHDEPLVRGHAVWAMALIDAPACSSFLASRLGREQDEYVRGEIVLALERQLSGNRAYPDNS